MLSAKLTQPIIDANSQWEYNTKGDNKWCIKGTEICMDLVQPVAESGQEIKMISGSKTKWVNLPVTGV